MDKDIGGRFSSKGKIIIHVLLIVYGLILAYILSGLIFKFNISANIFFDLSFALLFFSVGQAFYELGIKKAILFLLISSVIGFLAEVLGTSTGFPFGKYYYTDFLGPKVFGVPEVVPLVWFVIAYLTFSIASSATLAPQRAGRNYILSLAVLSAFGAVAWDFMVDPMFSSYGYWVWTGQFLPLPKLDGIPLTNFVGWFVLVTLMVSVYLVVSKSKNKIKLRKNTLDSQLAYFFLVIDGTIANWNLGNVYIIVLGASAMLAFLAISFLYSGENRPKIVSPAQVAGKEGSQ